MIVEKPHGAWVFDGIVLDEIVGFDGCGVSVPAGFRRGVLELAYKLISLRSRQGVERDEFWSRIWSERAILRGRGRGILEFSRQTGGLWARILRNQRSGECRGFRRGGLGLSGYSGSRPWGYSSCWPASDCGSLNGSGQSRGGLFLAEISHRIARAQNVILGRAPKGVRT